MVPRSLYPLLRCPSCHTRTLYVTNDGVYCASCATHYPRHNDYLDMMPRQITYEYVSKYVSEEDELADELDYRDLAPPLLAAGVRNRALRRLLNMRPTDIVLDNGCGTAKFAAWNVDSVGLMVGSDPATLFADAASETVALVQADTRTLPFDDHSFDKAFSIDVLEHFPREVIDSYLQETARILRPGGQMLIFSNTRERSPIQPIIDISRHMGKLFVKAGVYDFEREARRKSDHLKSLETWEEVLDAIARSGMRPVKIVFWNSLFTTFVEHVLMKLGEVAVTAGKRAMTATPPPTPVGNNGNRPNDPLPTVGAREIRARQKMRGYLDHKGAVYYALQVVTLMMELDLWLFGWMRSGSYFVVIEK